MALWKMMCILVGFGTDQCCTEPRMFQILMLSCQQVPVGGEMLKAARAQNQDRRPRLAKGISCVIWHCAKQ